MDFVLRDAPLDGAAASDLLAAFASEIASLYPGWHPGVGPSADPAEFVPPSGAFVVAYADGRPVGCGASSGSTTVTRRSSGSTSRPAHARAGSPGWSAVRLDTGARQPQALALFRSAGYSDIADHNGNEFASHWLEKSPPSSTRTGTTRPR